MRIVIEELKKIWTIKILGIIALLSILYIIPVLTGYMTVYPRGIWMLDVDFAHHLTENYGPRLEHEDFIDFLNYEENIIYEVNQFIASRQVFSDAGIFDLDDFREFQAETWRLHDYLSDEELIQRVTITGEMGGITRLLDGTDLHPNPYEPSIAFSKWISFGNVVASYQTNALRETEWDCRIDSALRHSNLSEREAQRLIELRDSSEMKNIMPFSAITLAWRHGQLLAAIALLATLVLVSQIVTTDRANRVHWLQYSAKEGRAILRKQFAAMLISAIGITTVYVIVFAGILSTLDVQAFWGNGINSFMSWHFHWLSITFGQFCLLIIGVVYVLSIGAAALAFILARFSSNRVRLMFKIVPLFVGAIILANWVLEHFLTVSVGGNWVLQLAVLGGLMVAGVSAALLIVRREKRVELV